VSSRIAGHLPLPALVPLVEGWQRGIDRRERVAGRACLQISKIKVVPLNISHSCCTLRHVLQFGHPVAGRARRLRRAGVFRTLEVVLAAWQRHCDVCRIRPHKCASKLTLQCLLRNRSVACSSVLSFCLFYLQRCFLIARLFLVIEREMLNLSKPPTSHPLNLRLCAFKASCFHWGSVAVKCSFLMLGLPSGVESLLSVSCHLTLLFLYDLPLGLPHAR
jgi:hypothetical protein